MVLWFARGLRRGVLTTRYPRTAPDRWTETLPTPPQFDPHRLDTGTADVLVAVCPSRALRRTDHTLIYDIGACTACGRCLTAAPGAVRPSGVFELSAVDRAHLIKHIPLREPPAREGLS